MEGEEQGARGWEVSRESHESRERTLEAGFRQVAASGVLLILQERLRCIRLGCDSLAHREMQQMAELAQAAQCYLMLAIEQAGGPSARGECYHGLWPWPTGWKPDRNDPVPNLVKAGALIAAEIDRLQRMKSSQGSTESHPTGKEGAQ